MAKLFFTFIVLLQQGKFLSGQGKLLLSMQLCEHMFLQITNVLFAIYPNLIKGV